MKILIAPDKFKGSLSATAAAEAIARGVRTALPGAEVTLAPIADGGEGFAEALSTALGGEWVRTTACDPRGREVEARYAWIATEKLAILDMSEASGLWRIAAAERDPLRATTRGTGQLLRHAMDRGARKILVGLGGSATTDGGIGMASALGFRFIARDGAPLPATAAALPYLLRIERESMPPFPEIVAACDVQNPLLGPRGCAHIFAPQKGADEAAVRFLDDVLRHLADVVARDLGCDHRDTPGAGAAGGIAFGLMSFCGARLCSGFDLVAEVLRLEPRIAASDLVITGEGRLDAQTLDGKGPAGVAALARRHGKPVVAFAGSVTDADALRATFDAAHPVTDGSIPLAEAMQRGAELLEVAVRRTPLPALHKV
jgi:glycerate kinase